MASHQTRPPSTPYSPLNDQQQDDLQDIDDSISSNGCGCFQLFGFGSNRNRNYEGANLLQQKQGREEESWMVKKLKKVKEVSEMVAGPKWKNFIRKMGGYLKGKKQRNRFQYDPESYALNFDGGFDGEEDDHHPPIGFSSRFAVPLASRE
ncbi:hypothetical protein IC582_003832 [Cucumis melo]|uniref:Uncharacterized protein LOC103487383 n=2 Tax=Cucumis melo TaxID=3656 RepID=A0A1S3B8N4_CUCME|nr:uncharacterized protein LOC103487383 [Cucumis melo]KAA0050037.1 uncharacterized protein E6C27_scaffold675G00120 [Cucumis melo var. makuwa]TYK03641.1 uncharacterized protein E5676_scaffold1369G00700 [Cucumis melo var. makuwa]